LSDGFERGLLRKHCDVGRSRGYKDSTPFGVVGRLPMRSRIHER
jgi:hypothetical protein